MLFRGINRNFSCLDWEQVEEIGKFLSLCHREVSLDVVGLGRNWQNNTFDYAVGFINEVDPLLISRLQKVAGVYFELELPQEGWTVYQGKVDQVRELYENKIDCIHKNYVYELELYPTLEEIEIWIYDKEVN